MDAKIMQILRDRSGHGKRTSIRQIQRITGLTEKELRLILKNLQNRNLITIKNKQVTLAVAKHS